MSQLDDEQNRNLFYIINFLNLYYSSDTAYSEKDCRDLMSLYGELIQKIKPKGEYYKREVKEQFQKSHQGLDSKDSHKIPNHTEIINKFKVLNSHEQQNLKYLSWYLLHCKIINLDIDNPNRTYPIWQLYSQLIKDIKSLPINE
ncbi:hypothetical protein [Nostoc sp.]|uniref:hypothetical protein n=1 Tax=Nostoc sp. TaxID=1180 RepID=UPI002FFD4C56